MPNRPGILPPHMSPRTLGNITIPTAKPDGYGFCTLRAARMMDELITPIPVDLGNVEVVKPTPDTSKQR